MRQEQSRQGTTQTPAWTAAGVGLSVSIIYFSVLVIPLVAAADRGLSTAETSSWIFVVYGLAGLLSLIFAWRFRQPLALTGNVFVLIFVGRLGVDVVWSELVGAALVAGLIVLVLGPLGLIHRLANWLPTPIVFGLLAGLVFDWFVRMFEGLGTEPLMVGGTLVVYLVARLVTEPRIPAILPALVAGILLSVVLGDFEVTQLTMTLPTLTVTAPEFSLSALATATPVMVVLISVQANAPSMIFLRNEGYDVRQNAVGTISGLGTMAGSLLGPTGVSLSLPVTALTAGPDAGAVDKRHWSVYVASIGSILIALSAGVAAQLVEIVPRELLFAVVGLAVVEILTRSLRSVTEGPLVIGPVFAFAIAASRFTLFGLDALFWAIVGGIAVSLLLERDGWTEAIAGQRG